MMFPTTWQFVKRYPYLVPFLVMLLLLAAFGHMCRILSQLWTWLKRQIVADEETSRRMDLVDEELDRAGSYHPCARCPVAEGCNQACLTLERWELYG